MWQVLFQWLWFFCIFYGKVKIWGSETRCRGKLGPKEDCCICPSYFHGFEPAFLLCVSWNCDFSWTAYHRDWQQVPLDSACLKPEMCTTEAILNHLCQSKWTKCEIFVWNYDFSGTAYRRDSKPAAVELACLEPLNTCHSSHFDAYFPVKIKKMWNFGCVLNSPWHEKLKKKINLHGEKVFAKALQICTYGFLGMPIVMHYVRTLCDKYFLSYYGSSAFFMGRSRYRVLKHGVGVKWDPRRTAAHVPSHFHGFEPDYLLCVS